jgi:hypothetical protein
MSRPEGAEEIYDRRSIWSPPTHQFYRPFRAGRFMNRHLGLKPQAESCSPFGTKPDIPLRDKPRALVGRFVARTPPNEPDETPCKFMLVPKN